MKRSIIAVAVLSSLFNERRDMQRKWNAMGTVNY